MSSRKGCAVDLGIQGFRRNGLSTQRPGRFTSLDFRHGIAVLTLIPQQSRLISVPRRPHARRKEFLYGSF
jgi:hypothetical protein